MSTPIPQTCSSAIAAASSASASAWLFDVKNSYALFNTNTAFGNVVYVQAIGPLPIPIFVQITSLK